jgi:cyclopropane fatty-acyl-phospholipid synthase-like methyltransferase
VQIKKVFGLSKFTSSAQYWQERYRNQGNSGSGSYDHLAEFKAEVINAFIQEHQIQSVIEFGCGDGNQLRYLDAPTYIGVDISEAAVKLCQELYASDSTKSFVTVEKFDPTTQADLTISLDVIYHLVEDEVYDRYMRQLFDSSNKHVIVYSSNYDKSFGMDHVRSRKFTDWIEMYRPDFTLLRFIPNRYPIGSKTKLETSIADFYIFEKHAS